MSKPHSRSADQPVTGGKEEGLTSTAAGLPVSWLHSEFNNLIDGEDIRLRELGSKGREILRELEEQLDSALVALSGLLYAIDNDPDWNRPASRQAEDAARAVLLASPGTDPRAVVSPERTPESVLEGGGSNPASRAES
jgi:hypothetical protein